MTENIGLLINSSRAIIYASEGTNFDMAAAEKAKEIQGQMASYLRGVNKVNS
jgi:orotidine-5'-phosphate decarboxylase